MMPAQLDISKIPPLHQRLMTWFGVAGAVLALFSLLVAPPGEALASLSVNVATVCLEIAFVVGFIGWIDRELRAAEAATARQAVEQRRGALSELVLFACRLNILAIEESVKEAALENDTEEDPEDKPLLERIRRLQRLAREDQIERADMSRNLVAFAPMLVAAMTAAMEVGPEQLKAVALMASLFQGLADEGDDDDGEIELALVFEQIEKFIVEFEDLSTGRRATLSTTAGNTALR